MAMAIANKADLNRTKNDKHHKLPKTIAPVKRSFKQRSGDRHSHSRSSRPLRPRPSGGTSCPGGGQATNMSDSSGCFSLSDVLRVRRHPSSSNSAFRSSYGSQEVAGTWRFRFCFFFFFFFWFFFFLFFLVFFFFKCFFWLVDLTGVAHHRSPSFTIIHHHSPSFTIIYTPFQTSSHAHVQ